MVDTGVSQADSFQGKECVIDSVAGKDSGVCKARELRGGLWGEKRKKKSRQQVVPPGWASRVGMWVETVHWRGGQDQLRSPW